MKAQPHCKPPLFMLYYFPCTYFGLTSDHDLAVCCTNDTMNLNIKKVSKIMKNVLVVFGTKNLNLTLNHNPNRKQVVFDI